MTRGPKLLRMGAALAALFLGACGARLVSSVAASPGVMTVPPPATSAPRGEPDLVTVDFHATENAYFAFTRPPSVELSADDGTRLGGCALAPLAGRCSASFARVPSLRITVVDATNHDRHVVTRVPIAPSLEHIVIDASHEHDAHALWWAELDVMLHASEASEGVRLVIPEPGRLTVENGSAFPVSIVDTVAFEHHENGAWTRAGYTHLACGNGPIVRGAHAHVAAGESISTVSSFVGFHWNLPAPEGPYRIVVGVIELLQRGTRVTFEQSATQAPTARIRERRLAVVETDTLEGFVE